MKNSTKHQHAKLNLAEKRHCKMTLKQSAMQGNDFACFAVLLLDQLSQISPTHTNSGVDNSGENGGWAGDANDPLQLILKAIKENK